MYGIDNEVTYGIAEIFFNSVCFDKNEMVMKCKLDFLVRMQKRFRVCHETLFYLYRAFSVPLPQFPKVSTIPSQITQ